jgi:arylformamidase
MDNIVDLTLPIFTDLPVVPGTTRKVRIEPDMTFDSPYKRNTSRLFLHSHMCSTHIDAPKHALEDGHGIDEYSLEDNLIWDAFVLDLRHAAPDARISIDELAAAIEKNTKGWEKGKMLCINTGWTDRCWGKPEFFKNMISLASPGVGDWLADLDPKGIVFDCYNDTWEGFMTSECFLNHKQILRKSIPLIEFCCNLDKLHEGEWKIYALPLKLVGCDGAPARVIAERKK